VCVKMLFLGPKCTKTRLRASLVQTIFLGSLTLAIRGGDGRERRGGEGRGIFETLALFFEVLIYFSLASIGHTAWAYMGNRHACIYMAYTIGLCNLPAYETHAFNYIMLRGTIHAIHSSP
jgi:hypothetical protein